MMVRTKAKPKKVRTPHILVPPTPERIAKGVRTIALPDAEVLRETYNYNSETGVLSWKKKTGPRSAVGKPVGSIAISGHALGTRLNGVSYLVHRIIWKWVTGQDPPMFIDHINGDPLDNRWCNLRLATPQENARNRKPHNGREKKGVYFIKKSGRWLVRLQQPGVSAHVGTFATKEEAMAVRDAEELRVFGQFARVK